MASSNTWPLSDRTNSRSCSPAVRSVVGHTALSQYANSKIKHPYPNITVPTRLCREDEAIDETEPHVLQIGVANREEVESATRSGVQRSAENLDDNKIPRHL